MPPLPAGEARGEGERPEVPPGSPCQHGLLSENRSRMGGVHPPAPEQQATVPEPSPPAPESQWRMPQNQAADPGWHPSMPRHQAIFPENQAISPEFQAILRWLARQPLIVTLRSLKVRHGRLVFGRLRRMEWENPMQRADSQSVLLSLMVPRCSRWHGNHRVLGCLPEGCGNLAGGRAPAPPPVADAQTRKHPGGVRERMAESELSATPSGSEQSGGGSGGSVADAPHPRLSSRIPPGCRPPTPSSAALYSTENSGEPKKTARRAASRAIAAGGK